MLNEQTLVRSQSANSLRGLEDVYEVPNTIVLFPDKANSRFTILGR